MGLVQPEQDLGDSPWQLDRESGIRLAFEFSDAAKGVTDVTPLARKHADHIIILPQDLSARANAAPRQASFAALQNVQQMYQRVDAMPAKQSQP
jgi:hypothetical protein